MEIPSHLVGCPFCGWMSRDCEVKNVPAFLRQHQEHIQDLEPNSGDSEEVYE
jgi:hypothetical protein